MWYNAACGIAYYPYTDYVLLTTFSGLAVKGLNYNLGYLLYTYLKMKSPALHVMHPWLSVEPRNDRMQTGVSRDSEHTTQKTRMLKVVWKSWGLPLTTYPFLLSPRSVYHPTPELGGGAQLRAGGWAPPSPPFFKPWGRVRVIYFYCNEGGVIVTLNLEVARAVKAETHG